MTVQLSQPDFQRLTRIVQNLSDFANVRDRRRLVAGALQGVAQADIILARLDLDGAPMGVSVEVVRFLAQFGRVAYDKEALAVFLNYIQPYTGDLASTINWISTVKNAQHRLLGLYRMVLYTNEELDYTVVTLKEVPVILPLA